MRGVQRSPADLVSLADRLRYMQMFRAAAAAGVMLYTLLVPRAAGSSAVEIAVGTAGYLAVSLVAHLAWRWSKRRGLPLFGVTLIIDGLFLAGVSHLTGGLVSPLVYLVILHLIAVSLLASYRTGMKLALWHSLLLFSSFHVQEAGLLDAAHPAHWPLPGTDFERLMAFTAIFWLVAIATSSFSAVNERELRRRRFDLEALAGFAAALECVDEPRGVARTLLEHLDEAFDLERSLLAVVPENTPDILAQHGANLADPPVGPAPSILARVRETRQTALVAELDPSADSWLATAFPAGRNFIVVPLTEEARCVGVLVAEHGLRTGSRVERRAVAIIERFASHATLALRNATLLEQVRDMATTDGLTAVGNRRAFDDALAQGLARASRTGEPTSLLMIDLDHFKRLNDTFGHQTGDDVLRAVASCLLQHSRTYDFVARYGGEEFAIVLPGAALDEATAMAERLRQAMPAIAPVPGISASIGVAVFPTHAVDAQSLVHAADTALYEAKRNGRDQVSIAATVHATKENSAPDSNGVARRARR